MSNFAEMFERLKLATSTKTQMELAAFLEIRQSSISDAKRRNSVPAEWCMKLFDKIGLNPDWVRKGTGPMYLRTADGGYTHIGAVEGSAAGQLMEDAAMYNAPDAKNVVVSVNSALEQYNPEKSTQGISKLSIPRSFSKPGLYIIRNEASSMEPRIMRDAYVGIDTSQKTVVSGEIYALNMPYEGIVLRRVYVNAQEKTLMLHSEDKNHPETNIPIANSNVVGRVSWVLQNL